MDKALFSFDGFQVCKVMMNFENMPKNPDIDIEFAVNGIFNHVENVFEVKFAFSSRLSSNRDFEIISVGSVARFSFSSLMKFEDIPDYFYSNSVAILFPYMRAFVSTVSLQSNIPPLILPTLNLTKLGVTLKKNSIQK